VLIYIKNIARLFPFVKDFKQIFFIFPAESAKKIILLLRFVPLSTKNRLDATVTQQIFDEPFTAQAKYAILYTNIFEISIDFFDAMC
jgi:hypothetical protein